MAYSFRAICWVLLVTGSAFTIGCVTGNDSDGNGGLVGGKGIVYGTVTEASGVPSAGVQVELRGRPATCEASVFIQESAQTNTEGRYRIVIESLVQFSPICADIEAAKDGLSGGREQVIIPLTLLIDDTTPVTDSMRVDIELNL